MPTEAVSPAKVVLLHACVLSVYMLPVGYVALSGRLYGVETPVNDLMQREARKAAVAGAGVGAVPPAELLAKL